MDCNVACESASDFICMLFDSVADENAWIWLEFDSLISCMRRRPSDCATERARIWDAFSDIMEDIWARIEEKAVRSKVGSLISDFAVEGRDVGIGVNVEGGVAATGFPFESCSGITAPSPCV